MTPLNALMSSIGEPVYYTPIQVWAELYQPDPMDAMANPPMTTKETRKP